MTVSIWNLGKYPLLKGHPFLSLLSLIGLVMNLLLYYRDKKARRAEKHKGKGGKKDEESSKSGRQSSPTGANVEADGEDIIVDPPPVPEEVRRDYNVCIGSMIS